MILQSDWSLSQLETKVKFQKNLLSLGLLCYFRTLMNNYNRNRLSGLKWTLFVLFTCYMGGITFFTHSHTIDNTIVVHSHPYKNKPINHHHSSPELVLIDKITHFSSTTNVVPHFDLKEKIVFIGFIETNPCNPFFSRRHSSDLTQRAPPALVA